MRTVRYRGTRRIISGEESDIAHQIWLIMYKIEKRKKRAREKCYYLRVGNNGAKAKFPVEPQRSNRPAPMHEAACRAHTFFLETSVDEIRCTFITPGESVDLRGATWFRLAKEIHEQLSFIENGGRPSFGFIVCTKTKRGLHDHVFFVRTKERDNEYPAARAAIEAARWVVRIQRGSVFA
jgi:hypothetical protein